jgi:hypothetical protein
VQGNSVQFLEVMLAIALIATLAFIALLINSRIRASHAPSQPGDSDKSEFHGYEFILAGIVILISAAALVWLFTRNTDLLYQGGGRRPLLFLGVMIGAGVIAFVVFIVALFIGFGPHAGTADAKSTSPPAPGSTAGAQPATHAVRLLGLLFLLVAYLILNWTALDASQQYYLMSTMMYPATVTIALVMLFDKVTRSWSTKGSAENFREWLFCDAMLFLVVIAFLNLRVLEDPETYRAIFWDFVQIVLFLFLFWLIDRTQARLRFLVAYGYLIGLPILLLIWRSRHAIAMPGAESWWESAWPLFFLAIIFLVLELILVIASRENPRHGLGAAKDAVFVLIYGILLLVAIPSVTDAF